MERIKIVEMKVSHLSKKSKGPRAPDEADSDADGGKDTIEDKLRSHFESAFTSALEKLESYGEIVGVI